ncbi:hypothetical protein E1171_06955 [Cytophagales bacterium RKSG123]|nr:hypothetical protein [Xanthovirga aplysinae]
MFMGIFALVLGNPQALLAQCAMCQATVANNVSNGDFGIATGLNFGILYLFAMPYLAFGVVAFFWYKRSRANAKKVRFKGAY